MKNLETRIVQNILERYMCVQPKSFGQNETFESTFNQKISSRTKTNFSVWILLYLGGKGNKGLYF